MEVCISGYDSVSAFLGKAIEKGLPFFLGDLCFLFSGVAGISGVLLRMGCLLSKQGKSGNIDGAHTAACRIIIITAKLIPRGFGDLYESCPRGTSFIPQSTMALKLH